MATTARGGRERRGNNSSSNSGQPKKAAAAAAAQPQKPLPNYLRPTISSSLDFSSSRASRRSKPPSPAHLRKALHSTTTTALRPKSSTAATRTPAPQRSFSSLSSRPTKAPAGPSTWRSSSAKASPANSSTSVNRVGRKAGPGSVTSDFDARDKDPSDHVIVQGKKLDAPAATVELDTVAKDAKNEDVIVAEEGELLLQEAAPCEKEQHPVGTEEERSNEEIGTEDREKDEHPVATEEERSNEERETEDRVNQGNGEEDSTKVDEKHVVVELEGSVEGSKVREDTSVEVVQVNTESPAIVKVERPAKRTQPRKETQAYNDVIEETASKLMENKRNKVRALAGAFEAVISLQDTK